MALIFTSCLILFMILVVVPCIESDKKAALIFNRFNGSLFELPNEVSKEDKCGAWASACLASQFSGHGLMKNALVVKEIYDRGGEVAEVKIKVCEEPHKVALAFDITKMNFRIGYAIYYKLRNQEYFHRSNLKHFMTPGEVTELMRKNSVIKGKYLRGEGFKRVKAAQNDNSGHNEELWFNGNHRMEFVWINLFSLRFDFFNQILMKIIYAINSNSKWPMGERCEDYSLGSEVYEEPDIKYIDNLYSETKQNELFESVEIPERPCQSGICPMKTSCESRKLCLSKWLLIPMDQFNFGSSTSPACSNLATIPIWTDKVEKVLKKVDQYLYSLYQVTQEALIITSGISDDILELPVAKAKMWGKKSKMYLDPAKKKIPVPKIIYKIVKYRFKKDPESQIYSAWYSAIIVMHNDPNYNGGKICSDVTSKWGWEKMTKDRKGEDFGNVYVCQSDGKILRILLGQILAWKQPPSSGLNLYDLPPHTKIKEKVDDMFKTISERGPDSIIRNEIMERKEETFQDAEDGDGGDGEEVKTGEIKLE